MYFNVINNTEVRLCSYHFYYDKGYQPEYEYKGNLIVPEYITLENNKYNVTEIWNLRPFNTGTNNTFLISVQIPSSVKVLYASFNSCSSLKNVVMQEGLTEIDGAFSGCKLLTNIEIPNSVNKIDDSSFSDCVSLAYINIPSGVTELGDNCFEGCINLNNFEEDELNNIKEIGDNAFAGCEKIMYVKLLNIEQIDFEAFKGCTNLKTIVLGQNCTKIGIDSFTDCINLTDVYCYATTPPSQGFSDLEYINFTLHVPLSAIDKYKESSWGWLYNDTERNIVPIEE